MLIQTYQAYKHYTEFDTEQAENTKMREGRTTSFPKE